MTNGTWLDDLSPTYAARETAHAAIGDQLALLGGRLLIAGVMFAQFIGFSPASRDFSAGASGSLDRQLTLLALAAIAAPLILMRWQRCVTLAVRSWPILLVFAVLAASALWSDYPGITIRRLAVLVIYLIIGFALAATLRTPRDYLGALTAGFAVILVLDLILAVALPGLAYDNLGLAGLHASKNVAGMVGLLFVATFASTLVGARDPALFWACALLLLLTYLFLVLTNSKTSLGLAVLVGFGFIPLYALAQRSVAVLLLLPIGALILIGTVMVFTGALTLSGADWAELTVGDPTFTGRDEIWAASAQEIMKSPWIGHGFGSVWSMLPAFHPLNQYIGFWTDNDRTLQIINQSHNGYIDLMIHGGLLLLVTTLIFLGSAARDVIRARGQNDRWSCAGNVFFASILITTILSNAMESSIFFPDGSLGIFLILFYIAHMSWQTRG